LLPWGAGPSLAPLVVYWPTMATPLTPFNIGARKLQYRPWSAIRGVTEAGKLFAELGNIAIDVLADPQGVGKILEILQHGGALGDRLVRTAITFCAENDLGDRVAEYLDLAQVEVEHEGKWYQLYGDGLDDACENGDVDLVLLFEAAFHTVRDGIRPLFARLASSAAGLEKT